MSICLVSEMIYTAQFTANHSSNVLVHVGDGKGSRNTVPQFIHTTSTNMNLSINLYSEIQDGMSTCVASGMIPTALFTAHNPSTVQVHLGDEKA